MAVQLNLANQLNETNTFLCCVRNILYNLDDFHSSDYLYNATEACQVHTHPRDNKFAYVKTIIIIIHEYLDKIHCEQDASRCYTKTEGWYNFYVLILIMMMIVGFIGNSLICFVFWKCKKLRESVDNVFITSLATADLLVVLVTIPIVITTALHNHNFCSSMGLCKLHAISDRTLFVASITNILTLMINRYIIITKPYNAREIISHFRSKVIIVLTWVYALFWGIMMTYNFETGNFDGVTIASNFICTINHSTVYKLIEYTIIFGIPCVVISFFYIRIYRISLGHAKIIDNDLRRISTTQRRNSTNSGRNSFSRISYLLQQSSTFVSRKKERHAIRVLLLVFGTFVVCWLPMIIISYVSAEILISQNLYIIFCEFFPTLNSILNPFIYGMFHKEFKSSIKKILGISYLQYQRRGSGGSHKTMNQLNIIQDVNTRCPSLSIITARSDSSGQHNLNSSDKNTTIGKSNNQVKQVCSLNPDYPVYMIPNDFYPERQGTPEHDKSIPVTPDGCKEKTFLLMKENSNKIENKKINNSEENNENNTAI